jgi:hypothetical protein
VAFARAWWCVAGAAAACGFGLAAPLAGGVGRAVALSRGFLGAGLAVLLAALACGFGLAAGLAGRLPGAGLRAPLVGLAESFGLAAGLAGRFADLTFPALEAGRVAGVGLTAALAGSLPCLALPGATPGRLVGRRRGAVAAGPPLVAPARAARAGREALEAARRSGRDAALPGAARLSALAVRVGEDGLAFLFSRSPDRFARAVFLSCSFRKFPSV